MVTITLQFQDAPLPLKLSYKVHHMKQDIV